jgi:GNAT superfamily N-acetyltransferase
MRCDDNYDPAVHEPFVRARAVGFRRLVEAGRGAWFGAFLEDRLVCQLGLFGTGDGRARFQTVETDPDFRRQGLAGGLVQHASQWGLTELGADTLVMVAEPDYVAIDLYRAVGFADTETQLQATRPAPGAIKS